MTEEVAGVMKYGKVWQTQCGGYYLGGHSAGVLPRWCIVPYRSAEMSGERSMGGKQGHERTWAGAWWGLPAWIHVVGGCHEPRFGTVL